MKLIELLAEHEALQAALAGAAGGIVRWLTLRENWKDGIAGIVVGGICAIYLGPWVRGLSSKWFGFETASDDNALWGFLIGLLGMGLTGFIIDTARRYRAEAREE